MRVERTLNVAPDIATSSQTGRAVFYRVVVLILIGVMICQGCSTRSDYSGENAYDLAAEQMEFGPRPPGSDALFQTGDWIAEYLKSYDWQVEEQLFEYRGVLLRNLTGKWVPERGNRQPILLGAHYDTRPHADHDPVDPLAPVPGANDGASGVAVLLELARVLSKDNYPDEVWLVFFDAEDSGRINGWDWIVGSTYFANSLEIEPQAVVIVDMVGDQDLNLYYELNSDARLAAEIWQVASDLGHEEFVDEKRYSILDDHIPFVNRGWPAVDIIDFDYPAWHTQGDTLSRISAESLDIVGETLVLWLWNRTKDNPRER